MYLTLLYPSWRGTRSRSGPPKDTGRSPSFIPKGVELGMQGIGQVDAFPPVGLNGEVHQIARLRQEPGGLQHLNQRRSDPLGDVGPALLTYHFRDLAANRKALEVGQRKGCGARDHAIQRKPPVSKPAAGSCWKALLGGATSLAKGVFEIMLRKKFAS